MKKVILLLTCFLYVSIGSAQDCLSALMPLPNYINVSDGSTFRLKDDACIWVSDSTLTFAAAYLQSSLHRRMNLDVKLANGYAKKGDILLVLDNEIQGTDAYTLKVTESNIQISAATSGGILYGIITLDQLMLGDTNASKVRKIQTLTIKDAPRLERRALMLDPARNFLPVEEVKFFMDQMLRYKFNVLQLHLTDDQGWRMQIHGHPELTPDAYYTQEDLKEIIEFGTERNIEVVPELDIPGHVTALMKTHPELGCALKDTLWDRSRIMLCAANPEVYKLYKEVIRQVEEVFPSPYIHLGGDEASIEHNWAKCSNCKEMMNEYAFTKPAQLMRPFFEKMLKFVTESGKKAILWMECNDSKIDKADQMLFDYPKDVILVTWRLRFTPLCIKLARQNGNKILLAPGEFCYLDYPQLEGDLPEYNNWGMPITTLEQAYQFDPGYGYTEEEQSDIWGFMGALWGEAIPDIYRACYMAFPRAMALSEAGWTQIKKRNWNSFRERLYPQLVELMKGGVPVRAPFEIADLQSPVQSEFYTKITPRVEINREGELWSIYEDNGVCVSAFYKPERVAGKYHYVSVDIENYTDEVLDFNPDKIKAVYKDVYGKEWPLKIYSLPKLMKKVKRKQHTNAFLYSMVEATVNTIIGEEDGELTVTDEYRDNSRSDRRWLKENYVSHQVIQSGGNLSAHFLMEWKEEQPKNAPLTVDIVVGREHFPFHWKLQKF